MFSFIALFIMIQPTFLGFSLAYWSLVAFILLYILPLWLIRRKRRLTASLSSLLMVLGFIWLILNPWYSYRFFVLSGMFFYGFYVSLLTNATDETNH